MTLSLDEFTARLISSGLITRPALTDFVSGLADTVRPHDGEQLAQRLVAQELLTPFQVRCLFAGETQNLVLGNYVVVDKLGQGGMGLVLKAVHRRMDRVVALKILSPDAVQSPALVERFHREVKAAAKLEHPNIVTAFDADEANGVHFFVMQFIEGKDLAAVVRERGLLPLPKAVQYILQAARGLEYAHRHGVIHRDIKPSNLLLSKEGVVKILDMGLARIDHPLGEQQQDHSLTGSGTVMGTVDYMSPEQALNTKHADAKSDQYSLGISLYFLLTGKPAYPGDTAMEKLLAHREAPLPNLVPGESPGASYGELNAIFRKMIAKQPEDRFASMTEVIDALTALQSAVVDQPTASFARSSPPGMPAHATTKIMLAAETAMATTEAVAATPVSAAEAPTVLSSEAVEDTALALQPAKKTSARFHTVHWAGMAVVALVATVLVNLIGRPNGNSLNQLQPDEADGGDPAKITIPKDGSALLVGEQSGWHGWPTDAPKPAIAPFDAAQAKKHQEEWAAYLKVPVEYTNSIGMKFRLIPPGEFLMGGTQKETEESLKIVETTSASADIIQHWKNDLQSEVPQHTVILTQPVYLGIYEVTQKEYQTIMDANPSSFAATGSNRTDAEGFDTSNHPVETVSWNAAAEFCSKLSQRENLKPFYSHAGGMVSPLAGQGYRLPTEAEWEFSCRAGTTTRFWIGDTDSDLVRAGWFRTNSNGRTHAVGELESNSFGLFDLHGNVWEWVQDCWELAYYRQFQDRPAIDQYNAFFAMPQRVMRGGHYNDPSSGCRASQRGGITPTDAGYHRGFRVSLTVDAVKQALKRQADIAWHGWPADAPKPAITPFDAAQAKQHQEEWGAYLKVPVEYKNSIGMKFVLIPPGEFVMGSTTKEIEDTVKEVPIQFESLREAVRSEAPRHKVILTQPTYIGVYEVTQAEYEKIMGENPSSFSPKGDHKADVAGMDSTGHPVEMVSWNDAAEFCAKLSEKEQLQPVYLRKGETVSPLNGSGYRLPGEAEWEFACRGGATTRFWSGDGDEDLAQAGWFGKNSGGRTHQVGELKGNPFGLFDTHGNVWEWVQDGWNPLSYSQFQERAAIDPNTPFAGASQCVLRSGNWFHAAPFCRSSNRHAPAPTDHLSLIGFRVALPVEAVRQALKAKLSSDWPADAPKPAIAPFDAERAKKHQEEWAAYLKAPVEYENSLGMKFRLIPPGEFLMGSTAEEIERLAKDAEEVIAEMLRAEFPQAKVRVPRAFYLGVTEVTQGEYLKVMQANPSQFTAEVAADQQRLPVETIDWLDAIRFCNRLSERENLTPYYEIGPEAVKSLAGDGYRLPLDAEWELACLAPFEQPRGQLNPLDVGWFQQNSGNSTHPVGLKPANSFGLFDLHGNVWEWCWNHFAESHELQQHPEQKQNLGTTHVVRGASWAQPHVFHRTTARFHYGLNDRGKALGLRVARSIQLRNSAAP